MVKSAQTAPSRVRCRVPRISGETAAGLATAAAWVSPGVAVEAGSKEE